jgi:hypothetical protein
MLADVHVTHITCFLISLLISLLSLLYRAPVVNYQLISGCLQEDALQLISGYYCQPFTVQ